jgi:hypothetical protein
MGAIIFLLLSLKGKGRMSHFSLFILHNCAWFSKAIQILCNSAWFSKAIQILCPSIYQNFSSKHW